MQKLNCENEYLKDLVIEQRVKIQQLEHTLETKESFTHVAPKIVPSES